MKKNPTQRANSTNNSYRSSDNNQKISLSLRNAQHASPTRLNGNRINKRRRNHVKPNLLTPLIIIVLIVGVIVTAFFALRPEKNSSGDSASESSLKLSSGLNSIASSGSSSTSSSTAQVEENTTVGKFFGPLYTATTIKPVTHNEIRALYLGAAANLDKNIEIANNSTINAFVIDLKESDGIYYKTTNELAIEVGAVKYMYNLESVVKKCKENNIKVIGRIVCFKDHILASKRPDLCIKDSSGKLQLYPLEGTKPFVNAYSMEVWQYNIDIAKEAISMGVDEIQFDYVRFPTCNKTIRAAEYFGTPGTVPSKIEAINRFLLTAKAQIQDELGTPLSGDIFGIVLTSKLDGKLIGQDWETVGKLGLDTLSPMIYPSHYAKNTIMNGIKFALPSADTYKFLNAVFKTEKFSETEGFSNVRCYIQAYGYTQTQLFGQIRALKDNGFNEYIYWNSKGLYTIDNVMK